MSQFASLAEQLETANVKHEMITYSGAPHAFTVFGSPRYREDADRKSWASFSNFLTATTQ
jgi:dienelactone hydrolase